MQFYPFHRQSKIKKEERVAAYLRVDNQLLSLIAPLLGRLGVDILVHSRRTSVAQQTRILFHILLDMFRSIFGVDPKVDGLIFCVVCCG